MPRMLTPGIKLFIQQYTNVSDESQQSGLAYLICIFPADLFMQQSAITLHTGVFRATF